MYPLIRQIGIFNAGCKPLVGNFIFLDATRILFSFMSFYVLDDNLGPLHKSSTHSATIFF